MLELVLSSVNGYICPADPGEPGSESQRMSVNDREGSVLTSLVHGLRVLEIGTGLGVSTNYLAASAAEVITVDIDPWVIENVFPTLAPNVKPLASLEGVTFCVDAAFIDGLHTYEACRDDILKARLHVKPGGMIIFHDLYIQGVFDAIQRSGLPYVHIQTMAGMALAWNER